MSLLVTEGEADVNVRSLRLFMPNGGEDGVIIAEANDGTRVEFRGNPYSKWAEDECSPMFEIHACLKRVNVSNLHSNMVETVTPWHPEWNFIHKMFLDALK